jgi:hypothetical protein
MTLYDLHEATIYKPITSVGTVNLEQTVKLRNSKQCANGNATCFDDLPLNIGIDDDIQKCLNSKDTVIVSSAENSI